MASNCSITFEVRLAWWVRPYLYALVLFALIHGVQVDEQKASRVIMRGLKLKVAQKRSPNA